MLTRKQEQQIESYLSCYQETVSMAESKAIQEGVGEYSVRAVSYTGVRVQGGRRTPSEVEQYVIKKIRSMKKIDDELKAMLRQIEIINSALKALNEGEYEFIEWKYFDNKSYAQIADLWDCDRTTAVRQRRPVLEKLYNSGMSFLIGGKP